MPHWYFISLVMSLNSCVIVVGGAPKIGKFKSAA